MSSHHFVKENQEPALFIADADAIPFEKIQELLEWSPTVVVSWNALDAVLAWGIKVDVVVVEEDFTGAARLKLMDHAPVRILGYPSGQKPLDAVFLFLQASRQWYVNVVTNLPDELFDLQANDENMFVVMFCNKLRWSLVKSGKFEKWLPAGTEIVIRNTDQTCDKFGQEHDGIIHLTRPGRFWVGERL